MNLWSCSLFSSCLKTWEAGTWEPCYLLFDSLGFFSCPLAFFNNPLAGRLDPRAFWSSFQLFKSRAYKVKLWGQAWDASTGHPIPLPRLPRSPLPSPPQAPRADHLDSEDVTPSGIVTLLVERLGFPRRDIIKVYPVNSGFAVEVSRPELRNILAAKPKNTVSVLIPRCPHTPNW